MPSRRLLQAQCRWSTSPCDRRGNFALPEEALELGTVNSMIAMCPGFSPRRIDELREWLGGQAWNINAGQSILAVEIFAGFGKLVKVAEEKGQIVIPLGLVHGQDLSARGARVKVQDLVRLLRPAHTFVSWPCTSFSPWQHIRMS